MSRILALCLLCLLLAGCGQKGPLYLPDAPDRPSHENR